MNRGLLVTVFILGVVWGEAETCFSCGSECQSACGTRHFRTCCFNYLKKRSSPDPLPQSLDPSLRLELWLARSKYPYYQPRMPPAGDDVDMVPPPVMDLPLSRNEAENPHGSVK